MVVQQLRLDPTTDHVARVVRRQRPGGLGALGTVERGGEGFGGFWRVWRVCGGFGCLKWVGLRFGWGRFNGFWTNGLGDSNLGVEIGVPIHHVFLLVQYWIHAEYGRFMFCLFPFLGGQELSAPERLDGGLWNP